MFKDFAETRETPILGITEELLTGRAFGGRPIKEFPYQYTISKILPSTLETIIDEAVNNGWAQAIPRSMMESASVSTTSYPEKLSVTSNKLKDKLSQEKYQKNWDDLNPKQQEILRAKYRQIEKIEKQASAENSYYLGDERTYKVAKLNINSKITEQLKNLSIKQPVVGRMIGNHFILNDKRYKSYQELAAKYINEEIGKRISDENWDNKSDRLKTQIINNRIDFAKRKAINEITRKINNGEL
jgi:hypothetical protein